MAGRDGGDAYGDDTLRDPHGGAEAPRRAAGKGPSNLSASDRWEAPSIITYPHACLRADSSDADCLELRGQGRAAAATKLDGMCT